MTCLPSLGLPGRGSVILAFVLILEHRDTERVLQWDWGVLDEALTSVNSRACDGPQGAGGT